MTLEKMIEKFKAYTSLMKEDWFDPVMEDYKGENGDTSSDEIDEYNIFDLWKKNGRPLDFGLSDPNDLEARGFSQWEWEQHLLARCKGINPKNYPFDRNKIQWLDIFVQDPGTGDHLGGSSVAAVVFYDDEPIIFDGDTDGMDPIYLKNLAIAPTPPAKLNSKLIKQAICDHIVANPGCIKNMFSLQDQSHIDESLVKDPKVWKRSQKEKDGNEINRLFHTTLSGTAIDELMVTVRTDSSDTAIISIEFGTN